MANERFNEYMRNLKREEPERYEEYLNSVRRDMGLKPVPIKRKTKNNKKKGKRS